MIIAAKNHKQVFLRRLNERDFGQLFDYLQGLSAETKKRFGPHPFDRESVIDFYNSSKDNWGYVAEDVETSEIVAYSILKMGYLTHDASRLQSYGLTLNGQTDCVATFAPSVADLWQSCGVGNALFHFILSELENTPIQQIILWGGVQMDNYKAVNYYKKNGFITVGHFQNNVQNYDMILELSH